METKHLYYDKAAALWRRDKGSTPARELRGLLDEAYEYSIEKEENRYFVLCIRRVEAQDWVGNEITQTTALNLASLERVAAIREIRKMFRVEGLFL
jgi:hypothetical protein